MRENKYRIEFISTHWSTNGDLIHFDDLTPEQAGSKIKMILCGLYACNFETIKIIKQDEHSKD